jgi:hypothetical protein
MTDLKTDYGAGDTLPAADVNAANAQINQNVEDISGKSDSGHTHTFAQLTDVINTARAEGKMIQVDADGKLIFVDPPESGGGLSYISSASADAVSGTQSVAIPAGAIMAVIHTQRISGNGATKQQTLLFAQGATAVLTTDYCEFNNESYVIASWGESLSVNVQYDTNDYGFNYQIYFYG